METSGVMFHVTINVLNDLEQAMKTLLDADHEIGDYPGETGEEQWHFEEGESCPPPDSCQHG